MFRSLKLAVAGLAIAAAAALGAAPAQAATQITYSGGQVWANPWTSALNTVANSPLRWDADDAGAHVWYSVFFDGHSDDYGKGTLPGLAAALTITLESVTNGGKTWTFDYALTNTSNSTGSNIVTGSRVADFSFDVSPDEKKAAIIKPYHSTTAFDAIARDVKMNASSTVGYQDICIKSGQVNNCNGGGNDGPKIGQTFEGGFTLTFDKAQDDVVFTDPMVRYQSISLERTPGAGRFGIYGYDGSADCGDDISGVGIPVAWVPEPSTWAMMMFGVGFIGATLRSKRRAAPSLQAA